MTLQFDDFEINPIHNGDSWKVCNFMVANEDRFKNYFPGTLAESSTPNLAKIFVENKAKKFENKEEFLFTLKHSETRELAGLIYIKELDYTKKQGEFAYCIGYPFKGKKLITKAVKLLSEYAFSDLDLKSLQIIVHKDNTPSINVAKNNNYKWIETLKNEFTPPNGKPLDMELYELHNL